jgi:nicotinate-nucleotide pyrophosphorylase
MPLANNGATAEESAIAVTGRLPPAVRELPSRARALVREEVDVTTPDELDEANVAGSDAMMLHNRSDGAVAGAAGARACAPGVAIQASGTITRER